MIEALLNMVRSSIGRLVLLRISRSGWIFASSAFLTAPTTNRKLAGTTNLQPTAVGTCLSCTTSRWMSRGMTGFAGADKGALEAESTAMTASQEGAITAHLPILSYYRLLERCCLSTCVIYSYLSKTALFTYYPHTPLGRHFYFGWSIVSVG